MYYLTKVYKLNILEAFIEAFLFDFFITFVWWMECWHNLLQQQLWKEPNEQEEVELSAETNSKQPTTAHWQYKKQCIKKHSC